MTLESDLVEIVEHSKAKTGLAISELPDGPEIQMHGDDPYRAASVIKVPILYELYRKHERGELDLEDVHSVSEKNISVGSGVIRALHRPLALTLKDLMTLMIIVSDNSATNELIDIAIMEEVNSTMQRIGLRHTLLKRKMMGDAGGEVAFERDNIMSPGDSILLIKDIYSAKHLSRRSCDSILEIMKQQQFKQKIPRYLPEKVVSATKSGTVKSVSNDIGILYLKRPVAIAVMCMDLDHSAHGSDVIASVGRTVYEYYSR